MPSCWLDVVVPRPNAAHVTAAAALLDAVCPGWASRIDVGVLDLSSRSCCILGQLYRPVTLWWQPSTWMNRWHADEGYSRGWAAIWKKSGSVPVASGVFAWPHYQDAWIAAIADRLHPVAEIAASPVPEPAVSAQVVGS